MSLPCQFVLLQFSVAGAGGVRCEPKLCVTVLGYCGNTGDKVCTVRAHPLTTPLSTTPLFLSQPIHIFVQGVHVDQENCAQLVKSLREDINSQENLLASACPKARIVSRVPLWQADNGHHD